MSYAAILRHWVTLSAGRGTRKRGLNPAGRDRSDAALQVRFDDNALWLQRYLREALGRDARPATI